MYHTGIHSHRLNKERNPQEVVLASLWKKFAENNLDYLLSLTNDRADISQRDAEVAATVIQWLGSPVGEAFLEDAGYTRKNR